MRALKFKDGSIRLIKTLRSGGDGPLPMDEKLLIEQADEIERLRECFAEIVHLHESEQYPSGASTRMNNKKAKQILSNARLTDFSKDKIYVNSGKYLSALEGDKHATLDGEFTADELDAIATWMRNPNGVLDAEKATT